MTIGILYESKEWSTFALRDRVKEAGIPVKMFDLQEETDPEELLSCRLILNRVFASAVFRGHQKALDQMPDMIALLRKHGVPMINPAAAHYYETSKARTKEKLAGRGFPVPKMYGLFTVGHGMAEAGHGMGEVALEYPCVVKPDCGGRTNFTFIARGPGDLSGAMENAPGILFIAEEYIRPEKGFVTRLEIIDHAVKLALKRGVAENGLSAYRLGSEYDFYKDLPCEIGEAAVKAMSLLWIEAGSMDIIENEKGFFIIDVNSVSNASEDNTEMFNFDLMKETAAYAVKKYKGE